ncbi:MAG: hypothetical protein ACOC9W_01455 [Persicimonas sp.]
MDVLKSRFLLVLLLLSMTLVSCGDGGEDSRLVGGQCHDNRDCAPEARCLRGGDYPDGFCSVDCAHSGHCPSETECIDNDGGVCLFTCRDDRDCPPRWECEREDLRGERGEAWVCKG